MDKLEVDDLLFRLEYELDPVVREEIEAQVRDWYATEKEETP